MFSYLWGNQFSFMNLHPIFKLSVLCVKLSSAFQLSSSQSMSNFTIIATTDSASAFRRNYLNSTSKGYVVFVLPFQGGDSFM